MRPRALSKRFPRWANILLVHLLCGEEPTMAYAAQVVEEGTGEIHGVSARRLRIQRQALLGPWYSLVHGTAGQSINCIASCSFLAILSEPEGTNYLAELGPEMIEGLKTKVEIVWVEGHSLNRVSGAHFIGGPLEISSSCFLGDAAQVWPLVKIAIPFLLTPQYPGWVVQSAVPQDDMGDRQIGGTLISIVRTARP